MSEVEFGWVIRRDDGKFFNSLSIGHFADLVYANIYECESMAFSDINLYNLQNCEVVKIEMKVVGDEKENNQSTAGVGDADAGAVRVQLQREVL